MFVPERTECLFAEFAVEESVAGVQVLGQQLLLRERPAALRAGQLTPVAGAVHRTVCREEHRTVYRDVHRTV